MVLPGWNWINNLWEFRTKLYSWSFFNNNRIHKIFHFFSSMNTLNKDESGIIFLLIPKQLIQFRYFFIWVESSMGYSFWDENKTFVQLFYWRIYTEFLFTTLLFKIMIFFERIQYQLSILDMINWNISLFVDSSEIFIQTISEYFHIQSFSFLSNSEIVLHELLKKNVIFRRCCNFYRIEYINCPNQF